MKVINSNHVIYEFKAGMEPIEHVNSGDTVLFKANDCFYQQVRSNDDLVLTIDFDRVNPATGPIYIEEAKIGDILKVEILKIDLDNQGSTVVMPDGGFMGDLVKEAVTRVAKVSDNTVEFCGIKQPIRPMIGVIGVSPGANQEGVPTAIPYNHGGNLDTTDMTEGSILYLPVREDGAFFALGDCHAAMGDGEVCISGLEIDADVMVRLSVIKNKQIEWPLLETKNEFMVLASEETIDKSIYSAGVQMVDYASKLLDMSWEEAYMFNSLFVDFRISQVVNSNKTIRAAVNKELISVEKLIEIL